MSSSLERMNRFMLAMTVLGIIAMLTTSLLALRFVAENPSFYVSALALGYYVLIGMQLTQIGMFRARRRRLQSPRPTSDPANTTRSSFFDDPSPHHSALASTPGPTASDSSPIVVQQTTEGGRTDSGSISQEEVRQSSSKEEELSATDSEESKSNHDSQSSNS